MLHVNVLGPCKVRIQYFTELTCCSFESPWIQSGGGGRDSVCLRETSIRQHLSTLSFKYFSSSIHIVIAVMHVRLEHYDGPTKCKSLANVIACHGLSYVSPIFEVACTVCE